MVENVVRDVILYFKDDNRRINHALKVLSFADTIIKLETESEKTRKITALAAVLHDIGIKEAERKHGSASGRYQELEGPPIAGGILQRCGYDAETVDRVCFLVGHHHSYQMIDGLDFQALVEADFLVNIFEDEMKSGEIESVRGKYFKTASGRQLLESMYMK